VIGKGNHKHPRFWFFFFKQEEKLTTKPFSFDFGGKTFLRFFCKRPRLLFTEWVVFFLQWGGKGGGVLAEKQPQKTRKNFPEEKGWGVALTNIFKSL